MRCVVVLRSACVSAAMLINVAAAANAEPLLTDTPGPDAPATQQSSTSERFLLFSGADLWRNGGTLYGGVQWAPNTLQNDGFIFKVLAAEGTYRYMSGATRIRGTQLLGAILPGWRFSSGRLETKTFGGLDVQNHRLSPNDPANSLRGTHVGARLGLELWWEPTETLMFSTTLSGSTIGYGFGIRGATGWRVDGLGWIGPEIETLGDRVYRQYRIGAHVTAFKTGQFEWSAGAGYVDDNAHRSGAYGRVSFLVRK
jgi:hypothetical protein